MEWSNASWQRRFGKTMTTIDWSVCGTIFVYKSFVSAISQGSSVNVIERRQALPLGGVSF